MLKNVKIICFLILCYILVAKLYIMPGWEAAAIQGGSDLFSSLVNNIWGQAQQAGQREHQYQMTDYLYSKDLEQWNRQNQFNIDMWNRQNTYNSPASQMARFKEAGLNPNLIYGQGTPGLASPVAASSKVQAQGQAQNTARPEMERINWLSGYNDMRMTNQQLKNLEQARLNSKMDFQVKMWDSVIKAKEAGFKDREIQMMIDRFEQEKKLWPSQTEAAELNVRKLRQDLAKVAIDMGFTQAQTDKLNAWLEAWFDNGINIDRDNAWQRKGIEIGNNIIGGYKDLPENWRTRRGLKPWQKVGKDGKIINIWEE